MTKLPENIWNIVKLWNIVEADDWRAVVCAARGGRLTDTALQLVKVVVEVNVTEVDWLANFRDYAVTIKLWQSYKVFKISF